MQFQSTLPARGATLSGWTALQARTISIHAPRTGSDKKRNDLVARGLIFQSTLPARGATKYNERHAIDFTISIHAPRTGSDLHNACQCGNLLISIHAPRTGSDQHGWRISPAQPISIHAPRTGSDRFPRLLRPTGKFQSTLPARGATAGVGQSSRRSCDFNPRSPHGERRARTPALAPCEQISIHAPRTGSDPHRAS